MLRIGLTGGTACGKSTVLEMFKAKPDVVALDADAIVHRLYQPGTTVYRKVMERFGGAIAGAGGAIDRKKLGEIVFKVPGELAALERIVHPAVVEEEKAEMTRLEDTLPQGIAIVEATKMLEAGTYKAYDQVLLVTCTPEVQYQRFLMRHPEFAPQDAKFELERRVAAQFTDAKRRSLVPTQWVIDNSGSREETAAQVGSIYERLHGEA